MKTLGVRATAAVTLKGVLHDGQSLDQALPSALRRLADDRNPAVVQALGYDTLRQAPRLRAVLTQLLRKPLAKREAVIECLALVGLLQLVDDSTAEHAAVHRTAEAARQLGRAWAVKLINAVLRNFQRRQEQLLAAAEQHPGARYWHPDWLLSALQTQYPEQWTAICTANNQRPPMWLRVNLRRIDRDGYLEKLSAAGIPAQAGAFNNCAIRLLQPCPVETLPGFVEGLVSVQDGAAQWVAPLMGLAAGQRILDACAAPGGKTGHMLESCEQLQVTALDQSEARLQRVRDNLQRLQLTADCVAADAAEPGTWWDGQPFDRILIDAPCSGTGVIRRHPDIKVLRRQKDLAGFAAQQQRLLRALWTTLAPGGRLVYTTCSVMAEENQALVRGELDRLPDARPVPMESLLPGKPGAGTDPGWQVLPGEHQLDGFYYAVLERQG